MRDLTIVSPSEQVAEYLRCELGRRRWMGTMPGVPTLAAELGVDHKSIASALALLERAGWLIGQGVGRPRRIALPGAGKPASLRIAMLGYDSATDEKGYMVVLRHRLRDQGHIAFRTSKTLTGIGMKTSRIHRLVDATEADAWIVCAASREVLGWFLERKKPTFALFGRRGALPVAGVGPDHTTAGLAAVRQLIAFGHQRIVMLVHESRRSSGPGAPERAILDEMARHGLQTGSYNLPAWDDTAEGFHRVLDELFRVTPPTALLIDEPYLFHAAKEHLAQKGILAPASVSLICNDSDPTFIWCRPSVAHIRWNPRPVLRRVVAWANKVARGEDDRQQVLTEAEYVEGGTVGPAPSGS